MHGPSDPSLRRVGLLMVALFAASSPASAEQGNPKNPTVVKSSKGLHFQLPPDWPVEERNGAVGPIPVEEYLARKFNALDARLQAIEQQVNSLDVRLRVLEEQAKQQRDGGLRSTE